MDAEDRARLRAAVEAERRRRLGLPMDVRRALDPPGRGHRGPDPSDEFVKLAETYRDAKSALEAIHDKIMAQFFKERDERGISIQTAAELMGISRQHLHKEEKERRNNDT